MTDEIYLFDSNLSAAIEDLIKEAKNKLMLISPYIDLSERVKSALKEQLDKKNPNFELQVLFGKNGKNNLVKGENRSKKLKESLEFFIQFPNVEIRFEERLHAKFYINDFHMIFSSMNLYNYSLENNIEFGIIEQHSSKGLIGKAVDASSEFATDIQDNIKEKILGANKETDPVLKFESIFLNSELLYKSVPILEDKKSIGAKIIGTVGVKLKEIVGKKRTETKLLELLGNQYATAKSVKSKSVSDSDEVGYSEPVKKKEYFKPKLLKTKQLSEKTGISSRKINSWFVDNGLMYKKDDEWYITKKGKERGGIEKEGYYGQEVLWPEEIASEIYE